MAKRYLEINNYSHVGALYISSKVFKDIALENLLKAKSLYLDSNDEKLNKENLSNNISCSLKDNKGELNIKVNLKKGFDANEECTKLQKDIYNEILLLLEQVPLKIKIKVEKII